MPEFKEGDRVQLRWSEEMLLCSVVDRSDHDGELATIVQGSIPCSNCPWPTTRMHVALSDSMHWGLHCWPASCMELVEEAARKETDMPNMPNEKIGTWAYEIVVKPEFNPDGIKTRAMRAIATGRDLCEKPTREGLLFIHHNILKTQKVLPDDVEVNIVRPFVRE